MTDNQSSEISIFFNSDRPIERLEDDRLGRRSFAESVARYILATRAEHGFTAAVTGEWGSGKTSVLNMIGETLERETDEVVVLRFNPWLFRGTAELVTRFFDELGAQIGEGKFDRLKDVARLLTGFGKLIAPHIPVPGADLAANVAGNLTDKLTEPTSLLSERDHLSKALGNAKIRVVVFIDDIDRLEYGETRELMRLVRLTSDLPYLIFLLAFDREHVAKSFDEIGTDGQLFLDKIVQLHFNLPYTHESLLKEMFFNQLSELVRDREVRDLDRDVWGEVYSEIVRPLLSNLRDIKRYLYSLSVTLELVGQEVALADLLGLEAVRVLRPRLYEELREHRENIVRSESDIRWTVKPQDRLGEAKRDLEAMLERARVDNKLLQAVFRILFPATHSVLDVGLYIQTRESELRRDRRIGCEDVLNIYLNAGIDESAVATAGIRELVDALVDEARLTQLLDSLNERQIEEALERLEDFEVEFQGDTVPIAVPVLANFMAGLPDDDRGLFGISPRFRVTRVLYRLLKRVEDPVTLGNYVRELLQRIHTLSGKLEILDLVGHQQGIGYGLISESLASDLQDQLVDELVSVSPEDLEKEWHLVGLVLRPTRWLEGEAKVVLAKRLAGLLEEDSFVLAALRSGAGYAYSSRGVRQKRLPWQPLVDALGGDLEIAVDRLASSESFPLLSEDDQDTIRLAQLYAAGEEPTAWEPIPNN